MRKIFAIAIGSLSLLGYTARTGSAERAVETLTLTTTSKIWVDGTSNVKAFSCTATKIDANVDAQPNAAPATAVKSASLVIPVNALDCRNETMNEHMKKALKMNGNPQITWRMTSYAVEGTSVVINGFLTIAGKENPIQLQGVGSADNGVLRVKGTKQFKMTEYGVKPPTMMFGTMRVNDLVKVGFDIALQQ
jgi:polyisoprenoid-binding protein YceI